MFASRKVKQRRPEGVSRRRKRQFGFETLEDRRVMSAQSLLVGAPALLNNNVQTQSYSSDTPEGAYQQLLSEMYWQALSSAGASSALSPRSIPTDPELSRQWYLINSGQQVGTPDYQPIYGVAGEDINVAPLWNEGFSGQGVSVAVIDSGVQLNHPDLVGNLDLSRQFNANTQFFDGSPIIGPTEIVQAHGTAIAGIIGATADNGIGGAGVAPGVTLVPINLLSGTQSPFGLENSIRYAYTHGIDIANNSFGSGDLVRTLSPLTPAQVLALRDSVIFGRNGLGMINVVASGNGAGQYFTRPGFDGVNVFDTSNNDGFANSRYTIAVTGVDHDGSYSNVDGTVTNYAEAGANVLVAAPTSSVALTVGLETGTGSGIFTTDVINRNASGKDTFGYNQDPLNTPGQDDPDRNFYDDPGYTTRLNGTSTSAAMVSGVIALMLEANPNLTWRDVQEILVRSARQNDPLGLPRNGAGAVSTNPWVVNQTPIFVPPDAPPGTGGLNDVYFPRLDPNPQVVGGLITAIFGLDGSVAEDGTIFSDRTLFSPANMTNGAGYTVSQGHGVYGEQIGYGHGVIDAELAVRMAQQWAAKDQSLPNELTYTTFVNPRGNVPYDLPAAERGNMASGFIVVPGGIVTPGIGGGAGFIDWFNEYFAGNPNFADLTYDRGASSLQFSVPASQSMSIESVDIKVSIGGDAAEALDHLRILLVSPSGTYSELNNFQYDVYTVPFSRQSSDPSIFLGDPGSVAPAAGFLWTFNTNRSWGERSDDQLSFNPVTNEPYTDDLGLFGPAADQLLVAGEAIKQGWRLVIENWDANDAFTLDGLEIAWHGSPITTNSQRVQGIVGVDDNRDDLFNFNRVITTSLTLPGQVPRVGDIIATPDLTQESFAANATVTVRRASDNVIVDQFVTGHDGNFYFDLVPDDYIVSVEDPLGRTAIDDTLTPAQQLDHFRNEWTITKDYFRVWDKDPIAPTETLVDANGDPLPWFDSQLLPQTVTTGMKGINFLLDPGPVAPQQAVFNGSVYADVAGDGIYNGDDVYLPSITVFADVNRNGTRDAGEITAQTDAAGKYSLVVPLTQAAVMNVGVVKPTNWTATKPVTAADPNASLFTKFARPTDTFTLDAFAIKPPANNIGGGGANQVGILLGSVFNDANNNTTRQATEAGAAGVTVYIDSNNSGVVDAGDIVTTTNEHGAFAFTSVTPGQKVIRVVAPSPLKQTFPIPTVSDPNKANVLTLSGSSTFSGIKFGILSTANFDYGDLPNIYGMTTLAQDGARHKVGGYYLGAPISGAIDAELDGHPSVNADGDNLFAPTDDEKGITFDPIVPGATTHIVVKASQSGFLQGWIDWNNDGNFDGLGERVITDKPLVGGDNDLFFSVPAGANVNQVYARFRFGTSGLGLRGAATFGEVEDYRLNVAVPVVQQVVGLPADSDSDGDVDGFDFLAMQRNMGKTSGATQTQGDATGDGAVNAADVTKFKQSYGASTAAVVVAATGDFDSNGAVDGFDFLQMQRGVGLAHPSVGAGDGNYDGTVNAADVGIWKQQYGQGSAPASFGASTVVAAANYARGGGAYGSYDVMAAVTGDATVAPVSSSADAGSSVRAALSGRPFTDLAAGSAAVREFVTHRGAARREATHTGSGESSVAWKSEAADVRRDRAFEDLFGSRRRQGLRAESQTEESSTDGDCDEAFALLGDHFEHPLA